MKRKPSTNEASSFGNVSNEIPQLSSIPRVPIKDDMIDIPWDPTDRIFFSHYHPNQRDKIRRKYLIRGPSQPPVHKFPPMMIGKRTRCFNPYWFNDYRNWLEYSVKKDEAFFLCCYLFKDGSSKKGEGDAFVIESFTSWNKPEIFKTHEGDNVNSSH